MISHWKKTWEKGTKGETAVPWAVWARFLQKRRSSMEGGVPAPAAAGPVPLSAVLIRRDAAHDVCPSAEISILPRDWGLNYCRLFVNTT